MSSTPPRRLSRVEDVRPDDTTDGRDWRSIAPAAGDQNRPDAILRPGTPSTPAVHQALRLRAVLRREAGLGDVRAIRVGMAVVPNSVLVNGRRRRCLLARTSATDRLHRLSKARNRSRGLIVVGQEIAPPGGRFRAIGPARTALYVRITSPHRGPATVPAWCCSPVSSCFVESSRATGHDCVPSAEGRPSRRTTS